ncbi:ABC transporter ATP-binding protein [Anaeromyxobacter oryzisoli]|uniref:ABC transporter ATP-binding protein n=1 Tax=Anaeromyxobacter oryzisoli TaxID=2925408 RepID=UPI001F5AB812|nr:ABC transporter ATP-binding protein [Anaeromyxobacter sp. SG63]
MTGIALSRVTFGYDDRIVLQDIDLAVGAGEFVCVLGQSGCGKSTLLRLIAGLSSPSSGSLSLGGDPIRGPGIDRGIVFQDYSLFPWLSVGRNIELALEQAFPSKQRSERVELAEEYLALVGLPGVFHQLPGRLSGGMRQRAAIARAFAIDSPVLLMDEPFGALDAITRARLQDLLLALWEQAGPERRKTIVFVTHDVEEALLLASEVVVLGAKPGRVTATVPIALPRPRPRHLLYTRGEFQQLRDRLLALLHADVLLALGPTTISDGEYI